MINLFKKAAVKTFSNMKLMRKMLLSYFLLIVIPFGLFTYISNSRYSRTLENLVMYSAKQSFEQSGDFISYKLEKVMDALNVIVLDKNVNEILSRNPDSLDIHTQIKQMNELSGYLKSFQNNDEIYNIKLYINDKFMFSDEKVNFLSIQSAIGTEWYKDLASGHKKILWLPVPPDGSSGVYDRGTLMDSGKKVSAVRTVLDSNDYLHIIGIVRIDILENDINKIVRKASSTKNNTTYIINSNKELISSSSDAIREDWLLGAPLLDNLMKNEPYFQVYRLNDENILLACKRIPNSDWTMVSITPYDEIMALGKSMRSEMLQFFLLIGTIAYAVAYIISYSITKRIGLLIQRMRGIKSGNFNTQILSNSKDEIGELIHNFNDMSNQLAFLVREQFRIGQEAKHSELLALQAQINPHFLYNTLDLINWTAINNNVPEISETVQSLSRFYKLSLSKGTNIISIFDELEHAKLYMDIQNRRFNNIFTFTAAISEEILQCSIIKIVLQPILENSIIHGILQRAEKKGKVSILGSLEKDTVLLTVKDDGVGIPAEQMADLLSASHSVNHHGYGIRNINERIKLYYGEEYGLTYRSAPGCGTEATVRIPAVRQL